MRSKKISYQIILLAIVLLPFSGFSQIVEKGPPSPTQSANLDGGPPPPKGLPINDHLPLLLIAGLGLGIYAVIRESAIKKVL